MKRRQSYQKILSLRWPMLGTAKRRLDENEKENETNDEAKLLFCLMGRG